MSLEYHNLMEDIVLQEVDAIMRSGGGCCCDICKTDVVAYALNHLPPHYVSKRCISLKSQLLCLQSPVLHQLIIKFIQLILDTEEKYILLFAGFSPDL